MYMTPGYNDHVMLSVETTQMMCEDLLTRKCSHDGMFDFSTVLSTVSSAREHSKEVSRCVSEQV